MVWQSYLLLHVDLYFHLQRVQCSYVLSSLFVGSEKEEEEDSEEALKKAREWDDFKDGM